MPIEVESLDLHHGGRIVVNDVRGTIGEIAHGCLLVTDLSAAPSLRLPRGPCPRAEVALDRPVSSIRLRPGGRVVVPVRCIAAPAGGCRGRVRLTANVPAGARTIKTRLGSAQLQIAPGARKSIIVRLSGRGAALVRGKSMSPEFFGLQAELRVEAVDPAGRRSVRRECCARLVARR